MAIDNENKQTELTNLKNLIVSWKKEMHLLYQSQTRSLFTPKEPIALSLRTTGRWSHIVFLQHFPPIACFFVSYWMCFTLILIYLKIFSTIADSTIPLIDSSSNHFIAHRLRIVTMRTWRVQSASLLRTHKKFRTVRQAIFYLCSLTFQDNHANQSHPPRHQINFSGRLNRNVVIVLFST